MNGHKLIIYFSLGCLLFAVAFAVNGLVNYIPSRSTINALYMIIFLFVGLLGAFTGIALKEQDRRIKNLENIQMEQK